LTKDDRQFLQLLDQALLNLGAHHGLCFVLQTDFPLFASPVLPLRAELTRDLIRERFKLDFHVRQAFARDTAEASGAHGLQLIHLMLNFLQTALNGSHIVLFTEPTRVNSRSCN
jgi:hypothetical protein